ncbi:MAG: FtsX-like permease family protein [Candidatus Altiarchaeia archaeon]
MFSRLRVASFLAYRSVQRGSVGINVFTVFVLSLVYLQIVFVSSILGGVTAKFNEQMIDYQTGNVMIEPGVGARYIDGVSGLKAKLEHLPYVLGVSPRLKTQASVYYKDKNTGVTVYGVDARDESSVTKIHSSVLSGEFISRLDRDEIVLGREVSGGYGALMEARSLGGVVVGDTVSLSMGGITKDFRVKGIYTTNFFASDAAAYVNIKDLEEVLGTEDAANEIALKTTSGLAAEGARIQLMSAGVREEIRTWRDYAGILRMIEDTLSRIRDIFSLIGIIVAFIVIFVVIFVSIVGKKRQIGVEKAIGIDRDAIIMSFIFQAAFYALLGMILGYSFMQYVLSPYTKEHPIPFPIGNISLQLSDSEAIGRASLLFIAAVIGSAIPAYQMAKRDALDLIRG